MKYDELKEARLDLIKALDEWRVFLRKYARSYSHYNRAYDALTADVSDENLVEMSERALRHMPKLTGQGGVIDSVYGHHEEMWATLAKFQLAEQRVKTICSQLSTSPESRDMPQDLVIDYRKDNERG